MNRYISSTYTSLVSTNAKVHFTIILQSTEWWMIIISPLVFSDGRDRQWLTGRRHAREITKGSLGSASRQHKKGGKQPSNTNQPTDH